MLSFHTGIWKEQEPNHKRFFFLSFFFQTGSLAKFLILLSLSAEYSIDRHELPCPIYMVLGLKLGVHACLASPVLSYSPNLSYPEK